MTKAYVFGVLASLCAAIVETAILSNITAIPSSPDLALLCALYLALENGALYGETVGFASGFILDALTASPLGLNCLSRSLMGYLGGLAGKSFYFDGIFFPMLAGFSATLLKAALSIVLSFLFPNVAPPRVLSVPFLFELGCNTALCPFVFKFMALFKTLFSLKGKGAK